MPERDPYTSTPALLATAAVYAAVCYALVHRVSVLSLATELTVACLAFLATLVLAARLGVYRPMGIPGLVGGAYLLTGLHVYAVEWLWAPRGWLLLLALLPLALVTGYALHEDRTPPRRSATFALLALLLVPALGLVGADATTGVEYETDLDEAVTVSPTDHSVARRGEVTVGEAVARNEFPFPREVTMPDLEACVVGPDRSEPLELSVSERGGPLWTTGGVGGGATTEPVSLYLSVTELDLEEEQTFAVERASGCDVDRERPTIVLWTDAP